MNELKLDKNIIEDQEVFAFLSTLDRDTIIANLIITYSKTSKEAKEIYEANFKNARGTSFVSIFDDFLLEEDRSEEDVIAFLKEEGTANKLKTKSHFISRASFASELRAKLEEEFNA